MKIPPIFVILVKPEVYRKPKGYKSKLEIHPKQWKRPKSEVWPQVAYVCRGGEMPPIWPECRKSEVSYKLVWF